MTRSPRLVPKKCEVTVSYDVVFPDTNVLVAHVMSRNSNSLVCAVFDKVRESDKLVVTNQVILADEFINIRADHIISSSAKSYRYQRGAAIPPLDCVCCSNSDAVSVADLSLRTSIRVMEVN